MRHAQIYQTCSAIIVAGGFASAEIASRVLDRYPGSAFAWYLNLALFRPFEQARAVGSPLNFLIGPMMLDLAVILVLVALATGLVRSRLGIALVTHLAFAATVDVARAWMTSDWTGELSLMTVQGRSGAGTCLISVLLVVSGLGCVLSHLTFAKAIHADARDALPGSRHTRIGAALAPIPERSMPVPS